VRRKLRTGTSAMSWPFSRAALIVQSMPAQPYKCIPMGARFYMERAQEAVVKNLSTPPAEHSDKRLQRTWQTTDLVPVQAGDEYARDAGRPHMRRLQQRTLRVLAAVKQQARPRRAHGQTEAPAPATGQAPHAVSLARLLSFVLAVV
jgi:hypothetical protein